MNPDVAADPLTGIGDGKIKIDKRNVNPQSIERPVSCCSKQNTGPIASGSSSEQSYGYFVIAYKSCK